MSRYKMLAALALGVVLASGCDQDAEPVGTSAAGNRLLNTPVMQADRFGFPAVATVFIPTSQKDAYNQAPPAGDPANYADEIVAVLLAFGLDNATASAIADALTPDIQPIDTSQPTGFLNGRRLQDDVITAELMLIFGSNAALNDDHVDANDRAFLAGFPYLADPHLP